MSHNTYTATCCLSSVFLLLDFYFSYLLAYAHVDNICSFKPVTHEMEDQVNWGDEWN